MKRIVSPAKRTSTFVIAECLSIIGPLIALMTLALKFDLQLLNASFVWTMLVLAQGCSILLVARKSSLRWGSLAATLVILTSFFHLGLIPIFWLGARDQNGFADYFLTYFEEQDTLTAATFVVATTSAFALGVAAVHYGMLVFKRVGNPNWSGKSRYLNWLDMKPQQDLLGILGILISLTGAIVIFSQFALFQGYAEYLTQSRFEFGAYGPFFVIAGWSLSFIPSTGWVRFVSTVVALSALGSMAFSGSRTWLFIGIVAVALVNFKSRGRRVNLFVPFLSLSGFLAVSALREFRDGLKPGFKVDPLSGMYELGGSLRPLYELMRLGTRDELTADNPQVNSFFVWPASKLGEIMNKDLKTFEYGVGPKILEAAFGDDYRFAFSNIAELFINFSTINALLVAFLSGIFIAAIDQFKIGRTSGAFLTLIFAVPLLYAIRQPATMIIPHVIIMLAFVAVVMIATGLLWQSKNRIHFLSRFRNLQRDYNR